MNLMLAISGISFLAVRKRIGFKEIALLLKVHLSSAFACQLASTWTAFAKYSFFRQSKMPILMARFLM